MKNKLIFIITISTSFLFLSGMGQGGKKPSAETYHQLEIFGEVFERVRHSYVEEVEDKELIEAAIRGMLTSLDPHSSYLDPESFQEMRVQTRGSFGGLGIEVTIEEGFVKVVSPIEDTPAYKAGIKSGDFITHLDGESILGLSLTEAVEKMRGDVGAPIELTIRRKGEEPLKIKIIRDIIKIRSVRWHLEDDLAYIRISTFNEQTFKGLKKGVDELSKKLNGKIKGLILDLRNNPGGLLDQAISVSDAFLKQGEIVSTRSRNPKDVQRFNAKSDMIISEDIPIVVLINSGSASASEIVAGALKDHKRAIVLGTRSFGKGSVQTIVPLGSDEAAMRLTTARYYTPSGTSIQGVGITPDIVVEQAKVETISDKGAHESDLRGSLDNNDKKEESQNDDEQKEEEKEDANETVAPSSSEKNDDDKKPYDYQLNRAIDLLKGVILYSKL